jgi:DNA repair protein RecN (Recombination protein N)
MLRSVYLKNYTLVDELTVDFTKGLSIVTGETGAGKSVIVGALNLLTGDRASPDLVRAGNPKAIIEAEFEVEKLKDVLAFLKLNEIEHTGPLIVRREISSQGASRAFVNDSPATLQVLKGLGALLIDLHGQHDHQSLLYPDRHRSFLDAYAGIDKDLEEYSNYFAQYIRLRSDIKRLESIKADWSRERDFLEFQFKEISSVQPEALEDERIATELAVREHAEELIAASAELHELLYNAEDAVYAKLAQAKAILERVVRLDPVFAEALKEVNSSLLSSRELGSMLSNYSERVEYDPARLNELRERQVALSRLKKKYGPSLEDVINTLASLKEKLDPDNDIDEQITQRKKELAELRLQMSKLAENLHLSRTAAAKKFEKAIRTVLHELGMENAQFEVHFETEAITENDTKVFVEIDDKRIVSYSWGIDKTEFYISTNKGEVPKPLARIASGGEISRIMLALKSVLSHSDQIPTLVFDEIDTGISGRVAQKVGRAMKLLGKEHQVISITHLGQIAAFADQHYLVEKKAAKNATLASIRLLNNDEHQSEIARLIAGETVSHESLEAAKALTKEANELVS